MKDYFIKEKIRRKLSKSSILTIRVKNNKIVMGKPCINCIEYMKSLGIKNIHYSDKDGNIITQKLKDITTTHKCGGLKMFKR